MTWFQSRCFGQLVDIVNTHRIAAISTMSVIALTPLLISDYRLYLSYGPGGLPYNAKGWVVARLLTLFSREQFSTSIYDNPELPLAEEDRYLPTGFPPERVSTRPRLGTHAVPQRQLDQLPSGDIRQRVIDRFAEVGRAAEKRGVAEVRQSILETQHKAIFVSKDRPLNALAELTRGEITHIHAGLDGSVHVSLHPADCKAVIEAGWGQRHPLSGVGILKKVAGVGLPINYVVIYAPRDEAEIEVAITLVKASIQFMTGSRDPLE